MLNDLGLLQISKNTKLLSEMICIFIYYSTEYGAFHASTVQFHMQRKKALKILLVRKITLLKRVNSIMIIFLFAYFGLSLWTEFQD